MSNAHTPGPWQLGERRHNATQIAAKNGNYIVTQVATHSRGVDDEYHEVPECLANARLIAAAPAMLDALRRVADWLDVLAEVTNAGSDGELAAETRRVRAAIEQATNGR